MTDPAHFLNPPHHGPGGVPLAPAPSERGCELRVSLRRDVMALKVLLADDDSDVRVTVADFLSARKLEVTEATNGLEVLLQLKRTRPDIVILDLLMPRLGGLDAMRRIRTLDPAIPVIVVTGIDDPDLKRKCLSLGAAAVLDKPVTPGAIFAAIEAARSGTRRVRGPGDAGDVLVVDDDLDVAQTLADFLDERGFTVRGAADAPAALRALTLQTPDVVLLGIHMPGLNGVDALPAIRSLAPHSAVIMVTGDADLETARRSLMCGAFDFIAKPLNLDYLALSVATAVALRRLEQ